MEGKGIVLGLGGPIAAGKTTISEALAQKYSFIHLRSSNVLKKMLLDEGKEITEKNLQDIGKRIINEIGGAGLSEIVLQDYQPILNYVYDSIRHVKDLEYFKARFNEYFLFLFVDAPEETRKVRYLSRNSRDNSEESYTKRTSHSVESEIELLRYEADLIVDNRNIDRALENIISLLNIKYYYE